MGWIMCPQKTLMLNTQPQLSWHVTLFGDRTFAEVISEVMRVGTNPI